MATDLRRLAPVAWLVIVGGCRPVVRPDLPPPEPGPVAKADLRRPPVNGGRQVMIGEMCPQGAAGRAGVTPLVMRAASWVDGQSELGAVIERGGVPRFVVYGTDGKHAGVFDTVGLADLGLGQSAASGTYVGAPPCTADAGNGQRAEDPRCAPATGGCGIAIGALSRPDDPPETIGYQTGGGCLAGDAIATDIDGDGVLESFPIASVLDGVRSPSPEWTAAPPASGGPPACKPTFQVYDVRLAPPPEPGKPADPKQVVKLHVLAVVDVDGDGRREIVLAFEFPTVRTIAVYTATGSANRLELAGEGQSFPR